MSNRGKYTRNNDAGGGRRGRGRGSGRGNPSNRGGYGASSDYRGGRGGGGRGRDRSRQDSGCFKCGQNGHFSRDCPNNKGGNRGRGRGGNRGRGRGGGGGGGGGQGCFNCGQQGHFSRDCPSNRGGNRGRGRGRGRGNYNTNRGRSSYNNRGRNDSRRSGFRGGDPSQRFHESASSELVEDCNRLNRCDVDGPQQVKVIEFMNGWQLIESLSGGQSYYHHPKTADFPRAVSTKSVPKDCITPKVRTVRHQDQGSAFVKPPHRTLYNESLGSTPIVTNAYSVSGSFLTNTVNTYLVEFEPDLHSENVLERRRAVMGDNNKQKSKNRRQLNDKFGFWEFNNNHLLSMGAKAYRTGRNDELNLSDKYKVSFRWMDSAAIGGSDLELTEEEQLLNTFKKRLMKDAGFREVRRSWFFSNIHHPPRALQSTKPHVINEKLTLLHGFACSMRLHECGGGGRDAKNGIFKADLANKQISTKSIHDIVADIGMQAGMMIGSKPFEEEVKKQLIGKFFIMSYNCVSNKITDVVFTENEHTTFTRKDGVKVSYSQHVKKTYSMNRKFKKEICVIKDYRGSAFLPQLANLTLRSDEIDDLKDIIQSHTNPGVQEQLNRVHSLVQHLNKSCDNDKENDDEKSKLKHGLNMKEECVRTTAIPLNYPDISFMAFGRKVKRVQLHPDSFQWGGREGTKGFLGSTKYIKKWVIVASNNRAIDAIFETYNAYIGMRGFNRSDLPLEAPETMRIQLDEPKSFRTVASKRWQLIFLCLPDGKRGSEIKTRFTKALQMQSKNNGCQIQAMSESTIFMRKARDAILGALEQAMGKCGNILYQITPKIPKNSPYNLDKIWTIGLDISHGGNQKGIKGGCGSNPSVAMMTLQTLPFAGTQKGLRNFCWLNSDRKSVIPYQAMATMTVNALRAEIQQLKNAKTQPQVIMIFRNGVPDNSLKEVHSKELVGVQRGIKVIRDQLAKGGIEWKVKVQFIVSSKDPIDKFGTEYNGRVTPLNHPHVVTSGITSDKLWDFFIWGYYPKADINKIKPKRFVMLKDDLKLGVLRKDKSNAGKNGPMALYEIIYSLSFAYHPSLPFIQGGTAQPSPITFARHNAEKFAQLITSDDRRIADLKMSKNLPNQPQVVTNLIRLQENAKPKDVKTAATPSKQNEAKEKPQKDTASKPKPQQQDSAAAAAKHKPKGSRRRRRR